MILYFAMSSALGPYIPVLEKAKVNAGLISYYYFNPKTDEPFFTMFDKTIVDSGGYTARVKGIDISVEEYSQFLNKYRIKLAFNLDTNDVDQTLENQDYLIKACPNTRIIPVYHMSDWAEKNNLLKKFVADGFEFVALGGMAGKVITPEVRTRYLDHCFSIIGTKVRAHGLGLTSRTFLQKYPFYSVDSTSWLAMSKYGRSIDKKDPEFTRLQAKIRNYKQNTYDEILRYLQLEKEINQLWEKRGLVWETI